MTSIFLNGWQPQFLKIEDGLNYFEKGKTTSFFFNGRRPQLSKKWKTSSIIFKREGNLYFLKMENKINIIYVLSQMEGDLNIL
jgi:hypothetical protein